MDFKDRTCIDMPGNAAFVETLMKDEQSYREDTLVRMLLVLCR